jgi:hypothetical protein
MPSAQCTDHGKIECSLCCGGRLCAAAMERQAVSCRWQLASGNSSFNRLRSSNFVHQLLQMRVIYRVRGFRTDSSQLTTCEQAVHIQSCAGATQLVGDPLKRAACIEFSVGICLVTRFPPYSQAKIVSELVLHRRRLSGRIFLCTSAL